MNPSCARHQAVMEEVRPGKFLCPDPECTACLTTAQIMQMQDLAWAQSHGMVHPDAMEIPGSPA